MHSITIASPFVHQALAGAKPAGIDIEGLLRECGISPMVLRLGRARVTLAQFTCLLRALVARMDDEAVGMLERPQRRGYLEMMGHALISAPTLGEAWQRGVRYQNLFENSLSAELIEDDDSGMYRLTRLPGQTVRNSFIIEQTLMNMHRFHAWLTKSRIPIRRVTLDYPPPSHIDEYRYLFFGAPIYFNQPDISLTFDRALLNLPNKQTVETLATFVQRAPLDLFTPLSGASSLRGTIRAWIEAQMKEGLPSPSLEDAGDTFGIHPQTLRRRLRAEDATYQDIKAQARRDLAMHLLNETSDSVESIAIQVGFSEPSAFIRAFRGWTGLTPLGYRKG
ncbi:AraC family transcriptional regulator [Halomonas urumqiensis]|uniref:AraC family transcriptional regulator n=1 Tax=Halomonas urumqiensis TaxID=1684789 RepID=A0A2N7UMH3_9GAMM|nr:AraC family transcriptional regulator [Halomonas urumqiensis]PMR81634.1 AraC family transcriptional regulator [Halomonas urumqiensis]PTB02271.1 AraC family transcriptional regulator [Halomonas urumqiensis]GHE21739.1 AraC family transcriptional regulator [Halomonas urumqiensis]